MSQDREPGWQQPGDDVRPGPAALDTQLPDLVAYCRAVAGREEDAVRTAHAVLDSAQSVLNDPEQLRAWLFALARTETRPPSGRGGAIPGACAQPVAERDSNAEPGAEPAGHRGAATPRTGPDIAETVTETAPHAEPVSEPLADESEPSPTSPSPAPA